MQTLVMVPAMINVLRPVAFTAATNSGLSGVDLTFTWNVLRMWRISVDLRDKGPFGPCGTEAVVITGIFAVVAILPAPQHVRATLALAYPHGLEKSALVIDKQHHRIVYINNRA